jgi:hypothetical protein
VFAPSGVLGFGRVVFTPPPPPPRWLRSSYDYQYLKCILAGPRRTAKKTTAFSVKNALFAFQNRSFSQENNLFSFQDESFSVENTPLSFQNNSFSVQNKAFSFQNNPFSQETTAFFVYAGSHAKGDIPL